MINIQLNKGQQEATAKLRQFIANRNNRGEHFVISGAPGSGKTSFILEALKHSRLRVLGCAVAHAAKNQLYESLNHEYKCFTLAQMLGMRVDYDINPGEVTFIENKHAEKPIKGADVVILDECSMIEHDSYDLIMKTCKQHNVFLIAMGDKRQCPPVGQEVDSKFFDHIDAELTEIMRFGPEIGFLEQTFRVAMDALDEEEDVNDHIYNQFLVNECTDGDPLWSHQGNGYGFLHTPKEMIKTVVKTLNENNRSINSIRLLAFRNKTVKSANNAIRRLLYNKKDLKQFEKGEIVICNGGYAREVDGNSVSLIYNGQILKVDDFKEVEGPKGIPCLQLKFQDFKVPQHLPIYVIQNTEEAYDLYEEELQQLLTNAQRDPRQWGIFWKFKGLFAEFDYAYAQSIYKSQGQTLGEVVVHIGDVTATGPLSPKQRYQALYVACTRARNKVYLYTKTPKS